MLIRGAVLQMLQSPPSRRSQRNSRAPTPEPLYSDNGAIPLRINSIASKIYEKAAAQPSHPGGRLSVPGECSLLNFMNRHTVTHPSRSTSPRAAKRNQRSLVIAAAAPLRAANPASAAQLLKRAHAESQAGKTASAILDYERAQWLAPHATTIVNQLPSVRAQAGLAASARSPLSRATPCAEL